MRKDILKGQGSPCPFKIVGSSLLDLDIHSDKPFSSCIADSISCDLI
jgi:hypothetical protein